MPRIAGVSSSEGGQSTCYASQRHAQALPCGVLSAVRNGEISVMSLKKAGLVSCAASCCIVVTLLAQQAFSREPLSSSQLAAILVLLGGSLDSDGDGTPDFDDMFPEDPSESADTDGDGVGDNSDAFPTDPGETVDTDGD